jgi:hypothetical protein
MFFGPISLIFIFIFLEYSTFTNRYSALTRCVYIKQDLRQPLPFIETSSSYTQSITDVIESYLRYFQQIYIY